MSAPGSALSAGPWGAQQVEGSPQGGQHQGPGGPALASFHPPCVGADVGAAEQASLSPGVFCVHGGTCLSSVGALNTRLA